MLIIITSNRSQNNINDGYGDAYTEAFFSRAESLTEQVILASGYGDHLKVSSLYLRAACLYRIARFTYVTSFPIINSEIEWSAWEAQKAVYMRAATGWELPVKQVMVTHTAANGKDRDTIPVYVRLPKCTEAWKEKIPVVFLITGLDGYRPDNTHYN